MHDHLNQHSRRLPPSAMPLLISSRKVDKATHYAEMRRAIFCLAPPGWAQWTVRFFEAVHLGCLPVTFSPPSPTPLIRPFEDQIDYAAFSTNVPPSEAANLRQTLEAIAANRTRLRAMQRAVQLFVQLAASAAAARLTAKDAPTVQAAPHSIRAVPPSR